MITVGKIRSIGNSKGVLIPKTFLEECGIKSDVTISIKENSIIISAADKKVRKNWGDFKKTKHRTAVIKNNFDDTGWTW
jgi:antitoxin MazE